MNCKCKKGKYFLTFSYFFLNDVDIVKNVISKKNFYRFIFNCTIQSYHIKFFSLNFYVLLWQLNTFCCKKYATCYIMICVLYAVYKIFMIKDNINKLHIPFSVDLIKYLWNCNRFNNFYLQAWVCRYYIKILTLIKLLNALRILLNFFCVFSTKKNWSISCFHCKIMEQLEIVYFHIIPHYCSFCLIILWPLKPKQF